eukprot:283506-Hanusia_phi.AAC.1
MDDLSAVSGRIIRSDPRSFRNAFGGSHWQWVGMVGQHLLILFESVIYDLSYYPRITFDDKAFTPRGLHLKGLGTVTLDLIPSSLEVAVDC